MSEWYVTYASLTSATSAPTTSGTAASLMAAADVPPRTDR